MHKPNGECEMIGCPECRSGSEAAKIDRETLDKLEAACKQFVDQYPPPMDQVYITDASAGLILRLIAIIKDSGGLRGSHP